MHFQPLRRRFRDSHLKIPPDPPTSQVLYRTNVDGTNCCNDQPTFSSTNLSNGLGWSLRVQNSPTIDQTVVQGSNGPVYFHIPIPTRSKHTRQRIVQNAASLSWVMEVQHLKAIHTVKSRYVELGHLELPAILPLVCFSHLLWAISNSVISNTPLSRTVSLSPYLKSIQAISNFNTFRRNTLVNIYHSRKCSQGTSWQNVLKAEKCIDVLTVTKAKSNWLDLLLRM